MPRAAYCPDCGYLIDRRHDGTEQGIDERTDPWVFVDHDRDDERGGTVFRKPCPASGRNPWIAAHCM
ncbi:hypothetical protein [Blastococcus sp. CCUG 61487]|uniref:hypothetical protein n=1 Tax=Blastococcus sp. CCUG 61487 TaxID=1840703 RepID=UPI0010C0AE44|nr:hypothetical protein [Blastococcus sp. CCUG 61487]